MPTEVTNPEFDFTSAREWVKAPSNAASRLVLSCAEVATTVTLTMDAFAIPADKFEEVANKVLQVRQEAQRKAVEQGAAAGQTVELLFGDVRVAPHASGQAWQISYTGSLKGKTVFAFLGFVTSRKIVHLYIETALPLAEGQGEIFQEVIDGFAFVIP